MSPLVTKKFFNLKYLPMQTKMKSLFLVPVDFSLASYKAAQYAMLLAQTSAGAVRLVHITDLDNIQHVENPLVLLNRTQRTRLAALERLRSLSEMMELQGVEVKYDVSEGNLVTEFERLVDMLNPTVVVMGKGTQSYRLISDMVSRKKIPAILVPEKALIKLPESVVLAAHPGPVWGGSLEPVLGILRNSSRNISILQWGRPAGDANWILDLNKQYGVKPEVVNLDDNYTILGTLAFIRSCNADLVCVVRRNTSFFKRLFSNNDPSQLANNLDVPVYLVSGD